ncbi:8571_t:CDS:2 [Funneliformis caledonium]|uniref:8571_t:CDS:1 n=1 Tax=Funneliformis caledonium TaxID=1117310 RepID=A0A9N9F4V9_9GLOM|nr:8571_t:CDS:2 [Funneliformis caledonium]
MDVDELSKMIYLKNKNNSKNLDDISAPILITSIKGLKCFTSFASFHENLIESNNMLAFGREISKNLNTSVHQFYESSINFDNILAPNRAI